MGFTHSDLLKETESLLDLMEVIGKRPTTPSTRGQKNKVVVEIIELVENDGVVAMGEVLVRVKEFGERERLGCLGFGEVVELVYVLKRLEMCKGRITMMDVAEEKRFWDSVRELKEKVGKMKVFREEGKVHRTVRQERATESDRFDGRVVSSIQFPSSRFL